MRNNWWAEGKRSVEAVQHWSQIEPVDHMSMECVLGMPELRAVLGTHRAHIVDFNEIEMLR